MTTIEEPPIGTEPRRTAARGTLATVVRMLLFPALGAVLGFLLLIKVVLPITGVGSVQRIVELGRHLHEPLAPAPTIAFLGNSITREGIDTRLVEEAAPPGWHAQNLAISACGLGELHVLLPKVLAARPAAVAFGLRPEDLGDVDSFDIDKAYAYALGGFVDAWPKDWTRADLPGIDEITYEALRSSWLDQQLHFRTAPLNVINQEVRLFFRRGLRHVAPDNWVDPYELEFSVRDARLQRHIESVGGTMKYHLRGGLEPGSSLIATLAAEIRAAGATPILIVLPMHPQYIDEFAASTESLRALLRRVAAEQQGLVVDALDVLSADDYADALHPNAEGREIYSRFLGRAVGPLAATTRDMTPAAGQ